MSLPISLLSSNMSLPTLVKLKLQGTNQESLKYLQQFSSFLQHTIYLSESFPGSKLVKAHVMVNYLTQFWHFTEQHRRKNEWRCLEGKGNQEESRRKKHQGPRLPLHHRFPTSSYFSPLNTLLFLISLPHLSHSLSMPLSLASTKTNMQILKEQQLATPSTGLMVIASCPHTSFFFKCPFSKRLRFGCISSWW